MTGRVDQVQGVRLPIPRVHVPHARRVELDGDAALALQVHAVQELGLHVARCDRPGPNQQPVRQRGLAVVDVGHDAKVAHAGGGDGDVGGGVRRGGRRVGGWRRGGGGWRAAGAGPGGRGGGRPLMRVSWPHGAPARGWPRWPAALAGAAAAWWPRWAGRAWRRALGREGADGEVCACVERWVWRRGACVAAACVGGRWARLRAKTVSWCRRGRARREKHNASFSSGPPPQRPPAHTHSRVRHAPSLHPRRQPRLPPPTPHLQMGLFDALRGRAPPPPPPPPPTPPPWSLTRAHPRLTHPTRPASTSPARWAGAARRPSR